MTLKVFCDVAVRGKLLQLFLFLFQVFFSIQLTYEGKRKQCPPNLDFHLILTLLSHQIAGQTCREMFQLIIFLYLSTKKKELCYTEKLDAVIMDTFKGQDNNEVKQLCQENNCNLTIVFQGLTNMFQALHISVSQSAKNLFQTNSTHSMLTG